MDEEICDGVKVLCERMENNPEDFGEGPINPNSFDRDRGKFYYDGRYVDGLAKGEKEVVDSFWYLNQAEKDALVLSYKKMMRGEFTRRIVEKLLDTPDPEQEIRYKAPSKGKGNTLLTTAAMQNASLALLNQSFDKVYEEDPTAGTIKYKALGRYKLGMP